MNQTVTHVSDARHDDAGTGQGPAARGAQALRQYLAFRLAGERYGIDIHDIVEILKYRPATPVPHAREPIHGIVSVRGRIITVVDGRHRLGLAARPIGPLSRIIVLRDGEESVGLLVDEVLQVEKLAPDTLSPPPSTLADAAERGIAAVCDTRQDSILIILDREAFLKF